MSKSKKSENSKSKKAHSLTSFIFIQAFINAAFPATAMLIGIRHSEGQHLVSILTVWMNLISSVIPKCDEENEGKSTR